MLRSRHLLVLSAGLVALFGNLACTPPQPVAPRPVVTAYTPKYQFDIPKAEVPGSAKVTIALIAYAQQKSDNVTNEFNSRFVKDLQNVLVARGYNVKGPFATEDELTYSDKKGSDFILTYGISFSSAFSNVQGAEKAKLSQLPEAEVNRIWDGTYTNVPLLGPMANYRGDAFYFSGELKNSAKINMTLVESLSKEKLWTKSIDISSEPESFVTSSPHALPEGMDATTALAKTTFADTGMNNPALKAADKIYNNAFAAIWKHLDPEELREIKKQSDEIKSKKVY